MKLLVSCLIAFAISQVLFADQITMKDGDRVTGDIIKKDGPNVTVKSKNFGTVTLKWDDIASIKSEAPLNVETSDGKTVKANIETQGNQIQVAAPGAPQAVAPGVIVALRNDAEQRAYERLQHPGILDLWTITGSVGFAGAKGNADTVTLTTPFNFSRISNTSKTVAYFNSIRSKATVGGVNGTTAEAVRGGWGYNRNLTKRVFASAFNDYEYDRFQALDLRVVVGGGLGYNVWLKDTSRLAVVGGAAWNREAFDPSPAPAFTRNSAEAYWGNDFNYKMNSRTSIVQTFRMFNNLTTLGFYRMNVDAGATTQLTKWLNWTISVSDRYLSDPVPGRKPNDFLYTTTFGFQWSR